MKNTNLILGKIGVGKTTGYMFKEINKMIKNNENLLIVDNKEEYYKTYAEELKNKGYNTYVINFKDPNRSNGFNPLLMPYKYYKNGDKDKAVKIVDTLSKNLIYNQKVMDTFWTDSASSYLTGLILTLFKEASEDEINLASVHIMISQIEKDIDKFREYVSKLDVVSAEYTFLSTTALAPRETRGGIISVLKMELTKYLTLDNLLNLFCLNEVDFSNIDNKTAIFIIGNTDYNKLTSMVINEVTNSNVKFNYILDNFDSLTNIAGFEDLLDNSILQGNIIYVISRNIENLTQKYGNLIQDKFENIENLQEGLSFEKIGNYNEYPKVKKADKKYFDISSIL